MIAELERAEAEAFASVMSAAARIEHGLALGAHAFTTETGGRVPDRPSGSYRNILRGGFREIYVRANLHSPE